MDFQLEADVSCHDLINPPAHGRNNNIDIQLINAIFIDLKKKGATESGTIYSLNTSHPLTIGFTTSEQPIFETEFKNLLLAFNLILCRICVTSSSQFSKYNIKRKILRLKSKYDVIKKDNKVFVNRIEDHIPVSDSVNAIVPHSASLEEQNVIEVFQKLQKMKRFKINRHSSIQDNNLNNSLENYENAMVDNNKISKYRHLFTALELVTDINGNDLKGSRLDNEVSMLSGVNSKSVEKWRQFYNRTKHTQKNNNDVDKYYNGENDLPDDLISIRKCVKTILLSKLK
jgi:hypothetical protein